MAKKEKLNLEKGTIEMVDEQIVGEVIAYHGRGDKTEVTILVNRPFESFKLGEKIKLDTDTTAGN